MMEAEQYDNRLRVDVRDNPCGFGFGVTVYTLRRDGNVDGVAEPLVLTKHAPGALWKPTFVLERDVARKLMDELWQRGIRPSSEGTEGQFAAQNAHLQDMRRIAFAALKTADVCVQEDADVSGVRRR